MKKKSRTLVAAGVGIGSAIGVASNNIPAGVGTWRCNRNIGNADDTRF